MAPSDFPHILIGGVDHPLSDDDPLLTSIYKSCIVCMTRTCRRCSKCCKVWYCCVDHENAHWETHSRFCSTTNTVERLAEEKRAIIKPLKYYDIGSTEPTAKVAGYHFGPHRKCFRLVDIKYRPGGGHWFGDYPIGPCPVLRKYFPDDVPRCILLESDGHRDFTEPIAIWYSERSLKRSRLMNSAIHNLFNGTVCPKRMWAGAVVAMKFASCYYHSFVPMTSDDLVYLKQYFRYYVGLQLIQ